MKRHTKHKTIRKKSSNIKKHSKSIRKIAKNRAPNINKEDEFKKYKKDLMQLINKKADAPSYHKKHIPIKKHNPVKKQEKRPIKKHKKRKKNNIKPITQRNLADNKQAQSKQPKIHNISNPQLHIKKQNRPEIKIIEKKEKITKKSKTNEETKYILEVDGAKVNVEIRKSNEDYVYNINLPKFNIGTESLLRYAKNELITSATINIQELSEQESFVKMKKRFSAEISSMLKEKLPHIEIETEKMLTGILMQDMLGLGSIEFLINDPNLEEIVIQSSKEPVRVYSKKYGWLKTNIYLPTEDSIINYANIIARRVGRQITVLDPLLDAHLLTGDRINAVLYPITSKGSTIVIRKFSRDPYTIIDLIKNNTCNTDIASLLWLAVEYEMNILVSGGTASGKTSFLNAFMPFIPPNHRIISIEDTRELVLPSFLYWNPLVTRTPNSEGKGKVTMLDLLVNSLRMRPDRIILGEMRKHEEAMVLFEAMHTGHSVYATVHADSAPETISRLTHQPLDIPANLLNAINLNVVMFRDRRRGIRRILQIAEIETEGDTAKANTLYRWSPESDKLVKHSKSSRFFEEIGRHTSMSEEEINKELNLKKKIISWLIDHKIRKLEDLGKTINLYYQNKEILLKKISKNDLKFILNYEK